jgi:hypothetical protein
VQPPSIADYTAEKLVFPAPQIRFSRSAAPIEQVGKAAGQGISMRPAAR